MNVLVKEASGLNGHVVISGTGAETFTGTFAVLEAFGDFKFAELEGERIASTDWQNQPLPDTRRLYGIFTKIKPHADNTGKLVAYNI